MIIVVSQEWLAVILRQYQFLFIMQTVHRFFTGGNPALPADSGHGNNKHQ